jgi:hypothetical protein
VRAVEPDNQLAELAERQRGSRLDEILTLLREVDRKLDQLMGTDPNKGNAGTADGGARAPKRSDLPTPPADPGPNPVDHTKLVEEPEAEAEAD